MNTKERLYQRIYQHISPEDFSCILALQSEITPNFSPLLNEQLAIFALIRLYQDHQLDYFSHCYFNELVDSEIAA